VTGEQAVWPRIIDLQALIPAVSGKIELVYEGEQQGPDAVARHVIGQAVKTIFHRHFPQTTRDTKRKRPAGEGAVAERTDVYDGITSWFSGGNRVEISDVMPQRDYAASLRRVAGLEEVVQQHLEVESDEELVLAMELVLEGLFQSSFVAKETVERSTFYSDMLLRMMQGM
jgi:magnesium chelatase subunit I